MTLGWHAAGGWRAVGVAHTSLSISGKMSCDQERETAHNAQTGGREAHLEHEFAVDSEESQHRMFLITVRIAPHPGA